MLGLDDSLVQGCTATVACHGNEHRLVVRDHALVALDHQSEAAKVLDALTDEVPCPQLVGAWKQTRWRFGHPDQDPYLLWLGTLIRADINVAEHEEWLTGEAEKMRRFQTLVGQGANANYLTGLPAPDKAVLLKNARASELVLRLPDRLRLYLGLLCAAEACSSGALDVAWAGSLEAATTACIQSWADVGYPSGNARVRVLNALRPARRRRTR